MPDTRAACALLDTRSAEALPATASGPSALQPPRHFERYRLGACIGMGGMGAVYEARHAVLNKRVALKTLHGTLHAPDLHDRFLHEAEIAARVRHPHVVDIYDAGIEHDRPFVVMELLEGETLAAYLARRGALSLTECLDLIVPLVAALTEVHRHGIVHRDVKPENVFLALDAQGDVRVKLVDFGISKELELLQEAVPSPSRQSIEGTPAYMSPEEFLGLPSLDGRVDQYGVGLVIYQCLSGRVAFTAEALLPLAYQVCHGECVDLAALRQDLPEPFVRLVRRAMAVDRNERFSSMAELGNALLAFASAPMRKAYEREFSRERSSSVPPGRRSWLPAPSSVEASRSAEPLARCEAPALVGKAPARRAFFASACVTCLLMLGAAAGWYAAQQPGSVPPWTSTSAQARR